MSDESKQEETPTPVDGLVPESQPEVQPIEEPKEPVTEDKVEEQPEKGDIQETIDIFAELADRLTTIGNPLGTQTANEVEKDLSEALGCVVGDTAAADAQFEEQHKTTTPREYRDLLRDPESDVSRKVITERMLEQTINADLFQYLKTNNIELSPPSPTLMNGMSRAKGVTGNKSGIDGKVSVAARLGGVQRVLLLNSGFYVFVKPFNIAQLYGFFRTVSADEDEFGKELGLSYYAFNDYFLKAKFMEFFVNSVVSSNLVGWTPTMLMDAISYQDYETCLWAACCLIHPTVLLGLRCANPECGYKLEKQEVKLSNIRLDNYRVVPPEVLATVFANNNITLDEVKAYQARPEFSRVLTYSTEDGIELKYHLRVPSASYFLSCAQKLVQQATQTFKQINNDSDDAKAEILKISISKMMWPWVNAFESKFNDGSDSMMVNDPDNILESLDETYNNRRPTLPEDIHKFILDTRLSMIAYTSAACSHCGAKPTGELDYKGLVPVNLSSLFFILASKRVRSAQK